MPSTATLTTRRTTKRLSAITVLMAGALALAGCQSMTRVDQNTLAGGIVGGGLAAVSAAALGASAGWVIAAGAAGAAAGAIYARNASTNQCAISNGNGTYRIVNC